MKPKRIYLIRHGESESNVNKGLTKTFPNWKIDLTEKGKKQAKEAAQKIYDEVCGKYGEDKIKIYCSPWYRCRQTAEPIRKLFKNAEYREDPRIREQEWGNFDKDNLVKKIDEERDNYGTFFYRMPSGESGADVYDRVSIFLESLHRDFEKKDYPKSIVIVSHGLTSRLFLMRWFHWSVEEYEKLANPKNCEIIKMELNEKTNKYNLTTPLRKK